MVTPKQVAQLSGLVAKYIVAQREKFSPQAVRLAAAQRVAMDEFFLPQPLDAALVVILDGVRVENPPFYPMLAGIGLSDLPDFSQMAAITFCDVVVSHVPFTNGLLFHEFGPCRAIPPAWRPAIL